jgi:DNA-binding CsgD family transcriptional regulator
VRRRAFETDLDLEARVARLTAGQRACLDLVDDHATSKEIALALGISRHTVDARLRHAMQVLGVTSRREAAIIWRASGLARERAMPGGASGTVPAGMPGAAGVADGYQPFAYQPSRIEGEAGSPDDPGHGLEPDPLDDDAGAAAGPLGFAGPAFGQRVRQVPVRLAADVHDAERAPEVADAAVWTWPAEARSAPSVRLWGGANDLTLPQRLAGILIVTIMAMLAFGLLLSGIAALTQLRT